MTTFCNQAHPSRILWSSLVRPHEYLQPSEVVGEACIHASEIFSVYTE